MWLQSFNTLSDEAPLWIYVADRDFSQEEMTSLTKHMNQFLAQWHSHGRKVEGAFAIYNNRVLVIAEQIQAGEISGCGIDASVHIIEAFSQKHQLSWLSGLFVHYRNEDNEIVSVTRTQFRERVKEGKITGETSVIDTGLKTLGELRNQGIENFAEKTWHRLVFRIPTLA